MCVKVVGGGGGVGVRVSVCGVGSWGRRGGLNFCVRGTDDEARQFPSTHVLQTTTSLRPFVLFRLCRCLFFLRSFFGHDRSFPYDPPPSPGKLAWPLQGKVSWYRVALASQLINPQSCTLSGNGRWEGWVLRNSVRGGWGVGEEKVRGRWGRGVGDRKVGWGWGWGCTAMTNK